MVQYYDTIPDFLVPWIEEQKVFWVATAPLTGDGFVNVSPKGMTGTFHVVDASTVWYEDLTGSGIETVAHVRENRRITICFNAFEGPPRICRIYARGTVHEFGTIEYDRLLPLTQRRQGSRAAIVLDVIKVSTSCGYAVPLMDYKADRTRLNTSLNAFEAADIIAERRIELAQALTPPRPPDGLKHYWATRNARSLDGLPGMRLAHHTLLTFDIPVRNRQKPSRTWLEYAPALDVKLVAAFLTGVMLTTSYFKYTRM
ncbi:hypothetical protein C0992_010148 [Termitomyces sp. T32_za158]|nr:hypothetical protein C0992_010148 [Termitomyces sp. T32_za158]